MACKFDPCGVPNPNLSVTPKDPNDMRLPTD
mgnify:CR=1 FL=1